MTFEELFNQYEDTVYVSSADYRALIDEFRKLDWKEDPTTFDNYFETVYEADSNGYTISMTITYPTPKTITAGIDLVDYFEISDGFETLTVYKK